MSKNGENSQSVFPKAKDDDHKHIQNKDIPFTVTQE